MMNMAGARMVWVLATSSATFLQAQVLPNAGYSAAQAARGKVSYTENCASCHGENLDDGEFAPPLKGGTFKGRWGGKPADSVFSYMSAKMPPAGAGGLGNEIYAQILAYMLQENGVARGLKDLPSDVAALEGLWVPGNGGGLSMGVALPPAPHKLNPLDKVTRVTEAGLTSPIDGDWLSWRRTYDDLGFSPVGQINRRNVRNLRVAWSWSLPNGPNEATPLVHDGVMFVHCFGDKIQALDAATGDLLWQYSRQLPKGVQATVKRNIAIYGDKLFAGTSDVHVVALDVKSGKVTWDTALVNSIQGFRLTGGPLVAKGKVMVGTVGRNGGGNYIVALDTETGKESWRFNVIPKSDEQGGNTWNGLPFEKRNGGSVWVAGSYDPVLNLAFFGVAQTYDTKPLRTPVNRPGITNDGLFTDSTLAINPDTGKLVWYFQHLPNDQWDLDWAFERQLIRMRVDGITKTVLITGGKQAIFDALEAGTGKYLFSIDLGLQNVVTAIDPKTGAKTIDPAKLPGDGKAKMVCPHSGGAKIWLPSSYNPKSNLLFVPLVESCMDLIPVAEGERGSLSSGVRWAVRPRPDSDGKYGRLEAINLETREVVWTDRQRAPRTTGVLDTAGGILFAGSLDRAFSAYDDATGKELWSTRLNDVPSSAPITYLVNGKQYIAMVVGNGGAQASTFPPLVPEIQNPEGGSAAVWVFELPEDASPEAWRTRSPLNDEPRGDIEKRVDLIH
jgi:alcohol dehydrogenase (cytochrome c)